MLGRTFTADEDRPATTALSCSAIVSGRGVRRERDALGRPLRMNGVAYQILASCRSRLI